MKKKRRLLLLFSLIWITFLGSSEVFPQPASKEEPIVKLGEITFRIREIQSSPKPLKILEIYAEVLNKSRRIAAPPNSIKAVLSQKEAVFVDSKPAEEFSPSPQEVSLSDPLPPMTGRVLIFGFPIPREKVEFITFEVQVNPPDGEKKTVKWEGN